MPSTLLRKNHATMIPQAAVFRQFHADQPLTGDPDHALLDLPEELFLWFAAAVRNEPRQAPDLPPGEWQAGIHALSSHGILPLIAWNQDSWPVDCRPPEEIRAGLSRTLVSAGARGLRAGRQIGDVTSALEDAGIPVLLMKGPALARTVYPDPALRISSDIDLLVRPDDIARCEPVFERLGYECPEHSYRLEPCGRHHQVFFPAGNASPVELHWVADSGYRMFRPCWLDTAFERAIRICSEDLSCSTLHPVDHLTVLAYHHVFQHQNLRLDWITDIAFLMQALGVPAGWEELRASSAGNHIRIPLEVALSAAALWTGVKIPEPFHDMTRWPPATAREQTLWRHAKTRQTQIHSELYLALQGLPTLGEKVRFCGRYILPPAGMMHYYRKSDAWFDLPLAYLRRWSLVRNYKL
ncbi:MAG: nucleotidyltransferase family protein [Methanomicrobiales archaeon]|nr:nucleotidyltransferase family protein [Methanomicrobiales archaeon]